MKFASIVNIFIEVFYRKRGSNGKKRKKKAAPFDFLYRRESASFVGLLERKKLSNAPYEFVP